jgi:hypothetical protein
MIAVSAPFLLSECHVSQELFHGIVIGGDEFQVNLSGILFEGIEAPSIFGIGMDIRIVKQTEYLISLFPEDLKGINGAGCAAYVEEDFHENFIQKRKSLHDIRFSLVDLRFSQVHS